MQLSTIINAAHLAPIWSHLPSENKLAFWAGGGWADEADTEGVGNRRIGNPPPINGYRMMTMVAGWIDEWNAAQVGRPVIYVEHGAGQSYPGAPGAPGGEAYSGTAGHDNVVLFISPSETVADRWRDRYPGIPAVAAGCPKMDGWHRIAARNGGKVPTAGDKSGHRTVAVTFHSDARVCPETETVWPHYEPRMAQVVNRLRGEGFTVIGHGHPRLWQRLKKFWMSIGVEPVQDFNDVLRRADILAVDNSSTGPEFASTGRPIVWMNGPSYRRDVRHGGRFWEWTEGMPMVEGPGELPDMIVRALAEPPDFVEARQKMVRAVYVACDGGAAQRAADAIVPLLPADERPYMPEPPSEAQTAPMTDDSAGPVHTGWPG